MLSRVFNSSLAGIFRAQPNTLSTSFAFCTTTIPRNETHGIRNKILGLVTFDEFNNFFNAQGKDFDPSCYSLASRTLAKILIETRMIIGFPQREILKNFLTNLQKVETDQLSMQEFSQLLYLLRVLNTDPVNNNRFINEFVKSIIARSENKFKELETETNVSRLCYFYLEYSQLSGKCSSILAKRISTLTNTNNGDAAHTLSVNEITLVLKGMRSKQSISSDEMILLKNVIRVVCDVHIDKLSFFELAQISVIINEIDFKNPNDVLQDNLVDRIHKKVSMNIDEMDEKSIMFILNGEKTNNRIYLKIYRIIFEKILDEIQPNGECSFNELFTLRLFSGISNKVRLASTSPENQEKFFNFLKITLTKTPRYCNTFLETYSEGSFFNQSHLEKVLLILESFEDYTFKLSLLHRLAKRKVNVTKISHLDFNKNTEVRDKNLVMLIYISYSLIESNPEDQAKHEEYFSKLRESFFSFYKAEDGSFAKLIFGLEPELNDSLFKALRKDIEARLPNPFETQQNQTYRHAYLKLLVFGNNEISFSKKYLALLKEKVSADDLQDLLKNLEKNKNVSIETISNTFNLVTKKFDLIRSNEQILHNASRMLFHQTAAVFDYLSSEQVKLKYWGVLNEFVQKLDPKLFFKHFSPTLSLILNSHGYDLTYSNQYQSFLLKVLKIIDNLNNKKTTSRFFEELIHLNLIRKADVEKLSQTVLDKLYPGQKTLLKMIESTEFLLGGSEITHRNLHLFLYNNSKGSREILQKHKEDVLKMIGQMKVTDLWKLLSHYRMGNNRAEVELLEAILKQLNKYTLRYEEFSPVFAAEVLKRNGLERSFGKIDEAKTYLKNALDYYAMRKNIQKIPLSDHLELIRYANDFKIRNEEYTRELLNQFHGDVTYFLRELYLLAGQMGVSLLPKHKETLVRLNFFSGFSSSFSKSFTIFLLFEKDIENPETHLEKIIAKYKELAQKEKIGVYSLNFEYLKKTYPEVTKDWQPNQIDNADFCRTIESHNSRNLFLVRELFEEVTKEKFVEHSIHNNAYYTFRNVALVFPSQSKYFGENTLMRRMLSTLTGIEKFIILNKKQTGVKSALKYILQIEEKLITPNEELEIGIKLEQKITQNRKAQAEQEAEEAAEEPAQESLGQPKN